MKNYEIKTATADYTGGGIYIYYGQLENGYYFRICDDFECMSICNADTSTEEADYPEFYEKHEIECITGFEYENLFNEIVLHILHNAPKGNYCVDELEKRMYELEVGGK